MATSVQVQDNYHTEQRNTKITECAFKNDKLHNTNLPITNVQSM